MTELLTIGEPMVLFASDEEDVTLDQATHFSKYSAGAELNVAIGVARLAHRVEYVSAVGDDPFGKYLSREIKDNGIATTYLLTDPDHWTGFYLKQLVSHGDPEITYFRRDSAAAHFSSSVLDNINFNDLRLAHLSGIFAALSEHDLAVYKQLNQLLNEHQIPVIFDPNLRPTLWQSTEDMIRVTNNLASQAQIIIPGLNEAKILTGLTDPAEIAQFYFNQSVVTTTVIIKMGPSGAVVVDRNGAGIKVSGYPIESVVDTVGAGDGFATGVITALLENMSMIDAVKRGCAIGAMAVMSHGDNDGYPTKEQLENFYRQHVGGRIAKL